MFEDPIAIEMVPLDPVLARIAAHVATMPPLFANPVATRRAMEERARITAVAASTIELKSVEDRLVVYCDKAVPVRIYRPLEPSGATAIYYHGGGFVVGSVQQFDRVAAKFCRDTAAVIVSVDYRLAPEYPFPAAHEDALAAALWAHDHVEDLGGNPARLALIGESAGGNLAACTALAFRDRGLALALQALIVPGADFAREVSAEALASASYPMLNFADMKETSRLYLGEAGSAAVACPPSPLRASSFAGLPPTLIAVAGHCPLKNEGLVYAQTLAANGVEVSTLCLADMFHPFLGFFDDAPAALAASDRVCREIRARLYG